MDEKDMQNSLYLGTKISLNVKIEINLIIHLPE